MNLAKLPYILFILIIFSCTERKDESNDSFNSQPYIELDHTLEYIQDQYNIDSIHLAQSSILELKDKVNQLNTNLALSFWYRAQAIKTFNEKKSLESTLDHFSKAITLLEQSENQNQFVKKALVLTQINLSLYLYHFDADQKVFDHLLNALYLTEQFELNELKLEVYFQLAQMYLLNYNSPEKCLEKCAQGIKLAQQLELDEYVSEFNILKGQAYNKTKEYNKALPFLKNQKKYLTSIEDTLGLVYAYIDLANLYHSMDSQANAINCIDTAKVLLDEERYFIVDFVLSKAKIERLNKQFDLAFKTLTEFKNEEYETLNQNDEYWQEMALLAKAKGDNKKAGLYFEKALKIKDDTTKKWYNDKLKALNVIEQIKKTDLEKKELTVKVSDQEESINYLLLTIIICVVAGIWIYKEKRKLDSSYKILVKKNRELRENLAQPKSNTQHNIRPEIKDKVINAFETSKVYLDHELSLTTLAKRLETNTSYLSKAINDIYGKNFNAVVNEFRIKEVLNAFENKEHLQLTIFGIAQKSGYKSKASFNRVFKIHTGVTPKVYIENLDV